MSLLNPSRTSGDDSETGSDDIILSPSSSEMLTFCEQPWFSQDITAAIVCTLLGVVGLLFTFAGYRLFKLSLFLTGFMLGSVLVYMICISQSVLPWLANVGIASVAGILAGLIVMLVYQIGLFILGLETGFILSMCGLTLVDHYSTITSLWICLAVVLFTGISLGAVSLRFQKHMYIIETSVCGAVLMLVTVDYFLERLLVVMFFWERVWMDGSGTVCWFSWMVLVIWPLCVLCGAAVQIRVTGRNYDHKKVVQRRGKSKTTVKLERIRQKDAQNLTYRQIHQVRRFTGDIISQKYLRGMDNHFPATLKRMTYLPEVLPIPTVNSSHRSPLEVAVRGEGSVVEPSTVGGEHWVEGMTVLSDGVDTDPPPAYNTD